jgi:hypothetical protein
MPGILGTCPLVSQMSCLNNSFRYVILAMIMGDAGEVIAEESETIIHYTPK